MDFKSRFNGRMSQIPKDGAIGVVTHTASAKPIEKMQQTENMMSTSYQTKE
jgi:hypothetical protein